MNWSYLPTNHRPTDRPARFSDHLRPACFFVGKSTGGIAIAMTHLSLLSRCASSTPLAACRRPFAILVCTHNPGSRKCFLLTRTNQSHTEVCKKLMCLACFLLGQIPNSGLPSCRCFLALHDFDAVLANAAYA